MSESNFRRLQELFDRISELPAEEWEAEIARETADAPELANELRALLGHAARSDSPFDRTAVQLEAGSEPPLPRVPGFRLHRCIGRGGSSTVYLAAQERTEFTREVALKVVDRVFDAASMRSVREEQRILARLEHPGIARLYDTGVTLSGHPWLAMEHVEGESILAHCRSRRLPLRARIELFLSVLDAVAYAHARGIVHRDLKPANIFVTTRGEAKLLDFGIAKLSDPADRDETRTLQRALTPAYASPEQIRGDRTTTASDIYSLGVVLYELLAGALPHAGAAVGHRTTDETELLPASVAYARTVAVTSTSPSDLREARHWRRALRGDVDAILAKALRNRPEERYASANAMADDLRRVLAGAPAAARSGDRLYRVQKFVSRHRVAFAVAIVVLLFGAGVQIARSWRATDVGRELAVFRDAEPVDSETRRWLRDGADRLARFDAAGARDSFRRAAAASKGSLPGEALAWDGVSRAGMSLGEIGEAAEAARRAGALIARHAGTLPRGESERLHARALAANRNWNAAIPALESLFSAEPERVDVGLDLVSTLLACGRTDAADTALGRLRQLAPSPDRNAADPRIDLQEAEVAVQLCEYQRAAAVSSRAFDRAVKLQAVAMRQRAARVHAEAIGRLDHRDEARRDLASIAKRDLALGLTGEAAAARFALAPILLRTANKDETRRTLEAALAGCVRSGDRRCEISARALLAMLAAQQGKLKEAIPVVVGAVADARAIGDRWCEGYVLNQLHVLYNWADDPAAEKALTEPLLAALRDSGNRRDLLTALTNLALTAIEALDVEKAEAYIVEAEGLSRRVGSEFASASVDRARATLEQARGDLDLARKSYTSALDKARQAAVPWNIGNYLYDLAWLEVAADRPGPAAQYAREGVAAFNAVGDTLMAASTEGALAWSEARQGDGAAAQRRLAAIQKAVAEDGSDTARFTFLDIDAHVAAASGNWRRAIRIRQQTLRMATEWNARGVMITQQTALAEALHGAGDRRALEKLVAEMLPVVERNGLRGVARDLRALVASR